MTPRPAFRLLPQHLPDYPFQKHPVTTSPYPRTLPAFMTICIAAIAREAKAIVTVSDMMLASDVSSLDVGAVKVASLVNGWSVMYAGLPTTFTSLRRRIESWLTERGEPKDLESMIAAIEYAYDSEFEHFVNRTILGHLGMTRADFKQEGLARLGERLFGELSGRMDDASKYRMIDPEGTVLLAQGFDENGNPHIVGSLKTGLCHPHDAVGFHTIGTGDWLAMASLQSHKEFRYADRLGEVCYRLHAAKFAAENSPFVGKDHTITTVQRANERLSLTIDASASRKYFNSLIARGLPERLIGAVETSLLTGVRRPVGPLRTEDPEPTKP